MKRTIGLFSLSGEDFVGRIETLTFQHKAIFIPNPRKRREGAPDYHVFANAVQLGEAWGHLNSDGTLFLTVALDDPCFAASAQCRLLPDGSHGYKLVWSR